MKKILIFASFLLFLTLFLPFIGLWQIDSFWIFWIFKRSQDFLSNPQAIIYFLCFIVWSFFISFWYSKKVKIPTMWLIWTFIYLKVFYWILLFITSLWTLKWLSSNDVTSYLFWNKWVVDVILTFFVYYIEDLKIWFYILIIGFLLNSIWIYNIVKNTYIYIDSKINWKEIKDEEDTSKIEEENNNEVSKKEEHTPTKLWKADLTIIFATWNVLNLIISIFLLLIYFSFVLKIFRQVEIYYIIIISLLFLALSSFYVNLFIINKYIKKMIDNKSRSILLLVFIALFLIISLFAF